MDHPCALKNNLKVTGSTCWLTRLSLAKTGKPCGTCALCESREAVNADRAMMTGPVKACPAMMATVPVQDCSQRAFPQCETCAPPAKAPAPAPAITTKEKERDIDMGKEKCACGKPGEVRKFGSRPTLCFACKEEWDAGKKPATKPTPRPVPVKLAAPVAKAPLAAPAVTEAQRESGTMIQQTMRLTSQFLDVIGEDGYPVEQKAATLLNLSEGVSNLSRVVLLQAEASLR